VRTEDRDAAPTGAAIPSLPPASGAATRVLLKTDLLDVRATDGKTVFIVHGHDHGARDTVELFLRRVGLNPIILAERPSRGDTVIEKIEREGVCDFAIVLLTPDDKGGPKDAEPSAYRYRARQNVLLELGFFIGKIGRAKVCALHKGGVEIPSDYSGVLWVPLDDGGNWKKGLGKELAAAGLPADLSKI
jgi:predicted nucleotide-binding protein